MAPVREGVLDLDLAVLVLDEAVGGFSGTGDERAGRIVADRANSLQGRDVRHRKGNALHLAQVAPDGFHTSCPPVAADPEELLTDRCRQPR